MTMPIVRAPGATELQSRVMERLEPATVVLDIGCGIRPQQIVTPLVHVCCEPCAEYIPKLQEIAAEAIDRDYVVLRASWADAVRSFPPGSVDTVFLVDVIEHLDKEDARALLDATVPLARRQVAVFTPLGFMPQSHPDGKDAWGLSGGAWQEHKSGWTPEDFGDGWESFVCEDFHRKDNLGLMLERSYGAFWAIHTAEGAPPPHSPGREARACFGAIRRSAANAGGVLSASVAETARIAAGMGDEALAGRGVKLLALTAEIRRAGLLAPVLLAASAIAAMKRSTVVRGIHRLLTGER